MSYSAHAIIGMELDQDKLLQEAKTVKAFEHNYGPNVKFCPNTGKECWKEVQEEIPEWDGQESLCGFRVHQSTEGRDLIVGLVSAADAKDGGNDIVFTKLPNDLDFQKQMLKEKLKPLGLWRESKFGLYSVLAYC